MIKSARCAVEHKVTSAHFFSKEVGVFVHRPRGANLQQKKGIDKHLILLYNGSAPNSEAANLIQFAENKDNIGNTESAPYDSIGE